MQSPPLQLMPVSTDHYFVSGDVTIHAGAAIAPGVLLQANPGSRIVIHRSACVGLGSVIHANAGAIEVGEGVIIGAGVLLIGTVTVGDRACVGSGTTVMNRSIASLSIVPPGSLLMDKDNEPHQAAKDLELTEDVWQENGAKAQTDVSQNNGSKPKPDFSQNGNGAKPPVEMQESDEIESPASQASQSEQSQNGVYGQAYVNRLLGKLFPEQKINSNG